MNSAFSEVERKTEETAATPGTETQTRSLNNFYSQIVYWIGALIGFFHLYVLLVNPIDPWILRSVHLSGVGVLAFLLYPSRKKRSAKTGQV